MKYRTLGRTNLKVSLVSLGTGGPSVLGQRRGMPESEAHRLVKAALDMGVNFIDTAANYWESEAILGRALRDVPRDRYYIATKARPVDKNGQLISAGALVESVEASLRRLQVEVIDLFQFHGLAPAEYDAVRDTLLPVATELKNQGKIRFVGVSEMYMVDAGHDALRRAVTDGLFDTVMVGYNMLNHCAERDLLPLCREKNVGVIVMMAVRVALSRPQRLRELIADLKSRGRIAADALPDDEPLGWLVDGQVKSVPAAAYKFVAQHPAVSTVLSGTANLDHFRDNVEAMLGEPLPAEDQQRIREVFGGIQEPVGN